MSAIHSHLPVVDQGQLAQRRAALQTPLNEVEQNIADEDEELQSIDAKIVASDDWKVCDQLRERRRTVEYRRDRLVDSRKDFQSRLAVLDEQLKVYQADEALATRRAAQAAGADMGRQIMQLVEEIDDVFHRYQILQQEDRVAADIVRSLDANRLGEVPTFSWSTGLTESFALAIGQVVSECQRAEKELEKRRAASAAT